MKRFKASIMRSSLGVFEYCYIPSSRIPQYRLTNQLDRSWRLFFPLSLFFGGVCKFRLLSEHDCVVGV